MAMKQTGRKIYRSMQGKTVDMDLLRQRNELTPAVGNARVNARGDQLGPGGKIVRKREELLKEYYQNSNSMPDENPLKRPAAEPAELDENGKDVTDDWIEDEDGNFTKRGE